MTQSPQPGEILSGARERLLGCADDDERHWSMDPREGWAVDVPVADLRLILSAYDRQEEEIERLRAFATGVEGLAALVKETDCPDRVKIGGEWFDGPLATHHINILKSLGDLAARARQEGQNNG